MKFDCIIMNPPYQRGLHLKILEAALKYKKEDGSLINLSPINWISDAIYNIKKVKSIRQRYQKTIVDNISDLDIIPAKEAQILFDINIWHDIGIYVFNNKNKVKIDFSSTVKSIVNKILKPTFDGIYTSLSEAKTSGKYSINIPRVHGNVGCRDLNEITASRYDIAIKSTTNDRPPIILYFNTEDERRNFHTSINTNFYMNLKYISGGGSPYRNYMPFMDSYAFPWTDEEYCKFFNLNENEKKFMLTDSFAHDIKDFISIN